jgi:hypothetical protein
MSFCKRTPRRRSLGWCGRCDALAESHHRLTEITLTRLRSLASMAKRRRQIAEAQLERPAPPRSPATRRYGHRGQPARPPASATPTPHPAASLLRQERGRGLEPVRARPAPRPPSRRRCRRRLARLPRSPPASRCASAGGEGACGAGNEGLHDRSPRTSTSKNEIEAPPVTVVQCLVGSGWLTASVSASAVCGSAG